MLHAIISDVHANIEALDAVLSLIKEKNCLDIVCLGDIVGYNSSPNECVRTLKESNVRCIAGNHDTRGSGLKEPFNFNPIAKAAIMWTRDKLSDENKFFLSSLPMKLEFAKHAIAFHGSLHNIDTYLVDKNDARQEFRSLLDYSTKIKVGFFGHTHVPAIYELRGNDVTVLNANGKIELNASNRYLVNPGSIGQPRDNNTDASFLMYDDEAETVEFHRVRYDVRKTYGKVLEAGLPALLAERLLKGI